ncbi:MAG: membrane protein insertion efficiency factor YidD [Deltaproteobacteria bacterium]|nr:membrane protein insertion efficiency factor YidD [Deltaproteobacteria bacterium]
MSRAIIILIRIYRCFLSPILPRCCRFFPSCSSYVMDAIARYGVRRGIWLGLTRLLRCHPGTPGGYDPVPGVGEEDLFSRRAVTSRLPSENS